MGDTRRDAASQAFPRAVEMHEGMTLRDYFAGQALMGLVQVYARDENVVWDDLAHWAYGHADAMLKARQA